jgi:glycosyltransferase involved in cell wall biosynthesis
MSEEVPQEVLKDELDVSICFPAYNEERNIALTIEDAIKVMEELPYSYEVLVVNDGSKDNTESIIKNLQQKYPSLRLYTHFPNQGYAITTRSCFQQAKGNYIIMIDSDRQHDLNDIPKFLAVMQQGYDLAVGWKKPRRDPLMRVVLGKGYNLIFRQLFNSKLHDVDCGFRCLRRDVARKIKIGYNEVPVGPEIFARALHQKLRIAEIVVNHFPPNGESTLKLSPLKIFTILKGFYGLKKELSKSVGT